MRVWVFCSVRRILCDHISYIIMMLNLTGKRWADPHIIYFEKLYDWYHTYFTIYKHTEWTICIFLLRGLYGNCKLPNSPLITEVMSN